MLEKQKIEFTFAPMLSHRLEILRKIRKEKKTAAVMLLSVFFFALLHALIPHTHPGHPSAFRTKISLQEKSDGFFYLEDRCTQTNFLADLLGYHTNFVHPHDDTLQLPIKDKVGKHLSVFTFVAVSSDFESTEYPKIAKFSMPEESIPLRKYFFSSPSPRGPPPSFLA